MSDQVGLCIECRHGGGAERCPTSFCRRPQPPGKIDPVSGEEIKPWGHLSCKDERSFSGWVIGKITRRPRCGPHGQFYEWIEEAPPPNGRPKWPHDWKV